MEYSSVKPYVKHNLVQHAQPTKAKQDKQYHKSPYQHYGVGKTYLRQLAQKIVVQIQGFDDVAYIGCCYSLFQSNYFEEKILALLLLEEASDRLTIDHMEMLERMTQQISGWVLTDLIGVNLVGSILEKDPSALVYIPFWAKSDNLWVRRLALVAQIKQFRLGKGDFLVFSRVVETLLNETNQKTKDERFFLNKAMGWALYERSVFDPKSVSDFVKLHGPKMSSLTLREATRKLTATQKASQNSISMDKNLANLIGSRQHA